MGDLVWIRRPDKIEKGLTIALVGRSGKGKTRSAMALARGFLHEYPSTPFVIIDTENKSSTFYRDRAQPWDCLHFPPDYASSAYVDAIEMVEKDLEAQPLKVCIIDQCSSEWGDDGGFLDSIDRLDKKAGKKNPMHRIAPKQEHNRFIRKIETHSLDLLILLFKEKEKWDWSNPNKPVNLGWHPDQDKEIIYRTDGQLILLGDGKYEWAKMRDKLRPVFPERGPPLTEDHGRRLRAAMLEAGAVARKMNSLPPVEADPESVADMIEGEIKSLHEAAAKGTVPFREAWKMSSAATKAAVQTKGAGNVMSELDVLKAECAEADKPKSREPGVEG